MRVIDCITQDHDLAFVALAALVCALGAAFLVRLASRARGTDGALRGAWVLLGGLVGGSTVWVTHFVAMLAYHPGLSVTYDPFWTSMSLVASVAGCGFAIALYAFKARLAPEAGGLTFGATVAAMHYLGMAGFKPQAVVIWDAGYIAASVVAALALGALAFSRAARPATRFCHVGAAVGIVLTIVSLHFTGMAALTVLPLAGLEGAGAHQDILAVASVGVGVLAVGAGAASWLLDRHLRTEQERELNRLTRIDSLTELPNRVAFHDRLDREIEFAKTGKQLAVFAIDLNGFKDVNDTHGHAAGDEVLRAAAKRMRAALRDGEFVARLGGDEFCALALVENRQAAIDLAERLDHALAQPVTIESGELMCNGSIGVALYPEDAGDKCALVANADLAMYRAKASASDTICFYEAEMDEAARRRRALVKELREALEREEFELRFQVQTSIDKGDVTGYEALLRWRHPTRGYVSPMEFIPFAEETRLIVPIGEWVLREACRQAAAWSEPHKVAVNLSAVQLTHAADLPRLVHETLLQTGLSPRRLELEITETAMMSDLDRTTHVLRQLKALGVSIAMDDFGVGYSSLSTLRAFAFDKIKLDKSFIDEVRDNPQARAIIRAVLALGESLDIAVLAEGVETREQLEFLRAEGCAEAQGYLFGRPSRTMARGETQDVRVVAA